MESLMKGEIQAFLEENNGQRIKYYERDLGTRCGKIIDLKIPRDRNNEFQTRDFAQILIGVYTEVTLLMMNFMVFTMNYLRSWKKEALLLIRHTTVLTGLMKTAYAGSQILA